MYKTPATTPDMRSRQSLCWVCADAFHSFAGEWKCISCIRKTTKPGGVVDHSYWCGRRPLRGPAGEIPSARERIEIVSPKTWDWLKRSDLSGIESRIANTLFTMLILPRNELGDTSTVGYVVRRLWGEGILPWPMRLCFCLRPFPIVGKSKHCSGRCAKRAVGARKAGLDPALVVAFKALQDEHNDNDNSYRKYQSRGKRRNGHGVERHR